MTHPLIQALEALRMSFGGEAAARKRALLDRLGSTRLATAADVLRLHELLCFGRAYPDDRALLRRVQVMLQGFERRADLQRHRRALADSGIAGTDIRYRFFWGQALWLAQRWPAQLKIDRSQHDAEPRLARALPLLVTHAEAQSLIESHARGFDALDRVRDPRLTDAAFLLQRIAAMPGDDFTREAFSDAIDAGYVLQAGPGTPSRTGAVFERAPLHPGLPPPRGRPELRTEITRPPRRVRRLPRRDAEAVVELARAAMVLRARSLEAFSFADARDAWLVDDAEGLSFAFVGVVPERRQTLATMCGGLVLRNGVPIGYLQADIVGHAAALSYNTFETFRGGEAAHAFARWLAALHHVHGVRSFSIEPYQLGAGNDEALDSGAWWFYAKLGFEPCDAATRTLAQAERARLARRPGARSGRRTLLALASKHLVFDLDPARPAPLPPQVAIGLAVARHLSALGGFDREGAEASCSRQALRLLGLPSLAGFNAAERMAWRRWSPIVVLLGVDAWAPAERRALVEVIRAKAARSEGEHVRAMQAHPRLEAALHALAVGSQRP